MKFKSLNNLETFTGTLLIPVFETHAKNLVPIEFHGVSVPSKVFYGKLGTHYIVEKYDTTHIFIGLGKTPSRKELVGTFRKVTAKLTDYLSNDAALAIPAALQKEQVQAMMQGLVLGTYQLGHYKKTADHAFGQPDFELGIVADTDFSHVIESGIKIALAQMETLRLVDLPPNVATPKFLADWAVETGKEYGFQVEIFGKAQSQQIGLNAFLAVGQGSRNEPQFIVMQYEPKTIDAKTRHLGLVGKGITFDTGGLNIKTAGMVHMKSDMAGGAAVLGAMRLIADLELPVRVTAVVPACENAIGPDAFAPSDVIDSYSGHSIEIIDTDAEGRLILADGLSYLIKNHEPDTVIDLATLTGSAVGTFGYECAALFTNNETLQKQIIVAGEHTGERVWPLPLWDAYQPDIESEIADVKNWSGKPIAGAITAAKFLEYFTQGHTAWAHLDIAGVAFGDDEFAKSKHATAFGVQLLLTFIQNL